MQALNESSNTGASQVQQVACPPWGITNQRRQAAFPDLINWDRGRLRPHSSSKQKADEGARVPGSRTRRVVVNYLPTRLRLSEDQSKSAMRFIFTALQMPTTENDGGVLAQYRDVDI